MPCIPSARVITILYPEAKATIVTEFVNTEISSLATKMMKVARRLCREAVVSEADARRRSSKSVWVWFQVAS